MIQQSRTTTIPAILSVRHRAPAAAAALPWYRAGGAPMPDWVFQPKGAASLADSYVNLANPGTNNATPIVAPGWDATSGWIFSGSQYLATAVVPGTSRAYAFLIRISDTTGLAAYGCVGIAYVGFPGITIWPIIGGNHRYDHGDNATIAGNVANGVLAIAGSSAYLDGVLDASGIAPGAGSIPALRIGCRWNEQSGAPDVYTNGKCQAAALWSTSTGHATWMPAVSAAVALI